MQQREAAVYELADGLIASLTIGQTSFVLDGMEKSRIDGKKYVGYILSGGGKEIVDFLTFLFSRYLLTRASRCVRGGSSSLTTARCRLCVSFGSTFSI